MVMNDSWSSTQGSSCYEQLRVVVDMNNSMLSTQGSRCYKQLRVVDNMNHLASRKLRSLDYFNSLRVRMIRTIFGREPMTLNVMNNSCL